MAHGVYTLQGTQHSDVNSFINHKAPHTESAQLYKGIMSDKSRGVFTGLIKVDRDAQFINSAQLNKNLLLSKGAHVNSRPQLEIFADDVKCSHGSTTGQLNEDELFYFESRGIRPEKARMMLSHAYTYDVLLKINNKNIRNYIQADIVEKFEKSAFEAKNA
jgi:Fe-S cluster assembly protein SufD